MDKNLNKAIFNNHQSLNASFSTFCYVNNLKALVPRFILFIKIAGLKISHLKQKKIVKRVEIIFLCKIKKRREKTNLIKL